MCQNYKGWVTLDIFALIFLKVYESESCSVVSDSLRPHGLYSPWNSLGQNTRVGSLSLFQGIFPTQELNPGLLHCRQILYKLSHKGSPRILKWVVYAFSSRSSQSRNWTGVSCIAGRFFTNWAIREALSLWWIQILEIVGVNSFQVLNLKKKNQVMQPRPLELYWFLLLLLFS